MPGYADVEDPKALLAQDPGLSGGGSVEEAISEAGFEVQAVNWVWEKVVGEDLVSSIITPITGDFEKIAQAAAQWNNVRDALQAIRNNLNGGLEELQPSWQGPAADRFAELIGTTWTVGIEADAQAAKLIGVALSKVADGSKRACDQALELIKKLVDKLIEAAAMLPIPVVGWGRAVKLVYDGIQIYNAIMSLIEGIQQIIEGAKSVIDGITSVGTALSKLGSADSLNDLINVGNEAGQGIADVKGGVSDIRDGATQASSAAGDLKDSAGSARDNARGLADERASSRPDNTTTSGTDAGGANQNDGSTPSSRSQGETDSTARPDDPNTTRTPENNRVCENDPVDVASGEVVLAQTDVELPGVLPLVLRRTHVSSYRAGHGFGRNWASTLDQRLEFDRRGVVFVADDGMVLVYPEAPTTTEVLPEVGPRWPLSRTDTGWAVTQRESGRTLHFAAGENTIRRLTAITDRNDNRIEFTRDPIGAVTAVKHDGGYHIDVDTDRGQIRELRLRNANGPDITLVRYRYHAGGLLAEVLNSSNRALKFDYDADGRLVQWTDRNGQWYRYLYDAEGRCVANQGSGGFLNGTFGYDPAERTTRFTDALGHSTVYRLDERGNVVAQTDPLGNTTTSVWDSDNRLVSRTDPRGATTSYDYDAAGNLTTVTRADGSVVSARYNELGLVVHVVNADGSEWTPEYDARGNLLAETDPAGARVSYSYDERGRLTSIDDALGQQARITTDAAGLLTSVTTASDGSTRYERDPFGRPFLVTNARGATRLGWTIEGSLSWRKLPDGTTERWRYDAEGNLTEYVDQTGNATRVELTSFDLPAARVEPDGRRLSFSYDPALRLTAVTNSNGQVWRYAYDAAGRVVTETDFDGRTLRYAYDVAGQLVERTNGAGQHTAFDRDVLGRVTRQRTGESVTEFEYDALGRTTSAVNADTRLTFERDAQGRVLAEDCDGRVVRSSYDVLGRRVTRVTPSGVESRWEYDAHDHPRVLHSGEETIRFRYDSLGREIGRDFGAASLEQTWDANNRLLTQTVGVVPGDRPADAAVTHPAPVQRRTYHYRPDGLVSGVDDQIDGSRRFALDAAGRVTAVSAHGWTERYVYDAQGGVADGQWSETAPGRPATVHRTSNVQCSYDGQGRVVMRARKRLDAKPDVWHYTWDGQDRLVAVVTPDGQRWRYSYDALGRRVAKRRHSPDNGAVLEETLFSWDGFALAERTVTHRDGTRQTTSWDWERDRFSPITQIERISTRERPQEWIDEQFYAIVTDLVGSPAELVGTDGTIAWKSRTTVWGAERTGRAQGRTSCPFRFPGQYHDDESGLHYNFHRHYDPETGNYVSMDPLGLAPSPNPRAYVGNPMSAVDPLGLAPPCQRATEAAQEEANRAQTEYPSGRTRPTAAAALVVEGHDPVSGTSVRGQTPPAHHPAVQDALNRVPEDQRSPSHGRCAEPAVLSNAMNSGVDPSGGTMSAVEVRGEGNPRHGDVKPPCSSCQHVLDQFGISAVR